MNLKNIILYIHETAVVGGIETFIYNFCESFHEEYNITVVTDLQMHGIQLGRLLSIPNVNYEQNNKSKTYVCDTLIMLRVTDVIPNNIRYGKVIRRIHTRKFYDIQEVPHDGDVTVCVSQSVKDDFELDNAVVINNMFKKIKYQSLLLVSATRLPAPDKGENEWRMRKLAEMMNEKNIPFLWLNFSDREMKDAPKNFYNVGCRLDVQNYMEKASYVVQLSTVEACSNTVIEALNLGKPLICTPVPCFMELGVKDGVNAHVVPFDMDFDVSNLLNVPEYHSEYDNKHILEQWRGVL